MLSTVIFGLTLLFLVIAQPTLAIYNFCPGFEDKGFLIDNTTRYNWYEAQQFCAAQGLTLVSINSDVKMERLREYLKAAGYTRRNIFWTSGSRLVGGLKFSWYGNGIRVHYTNWDKDQPDNQISDECISMINYKWHDEICFIENYAICESRWASNYLK